MLTSGKQSDIAVKTESPADLPITTLKIGIWQVLMTPELLSWQLMLDKYNAFLAFIPTLRHFVMEIYAHHPRLVILFIMGKLWGGIEPALLVHLSSSLLLIIEVGLRDGHLDRQASVFAVSRRLLCLIISAVITWYQAWLTPLLRSQVHLYFDEYLLKENLKIDLPTSEDNNSRTQRTSEQAWDAFEALVELLTGFLGLIARLWFIYEQSNGGKLFTLLCIVRPVLAATSWRSLWMKSYILYSDNVHYIRLQALQKLSKDDYREDVITGNIASYIVNEYSKARKALGNMSQEHPDTIYRQYPNPYMDMFRALCGDLPMMYCAASAIMNPSMFSVTSIAILQQHSASLTHALHSVIIDTQGFVEHWNNIKSLYKVLEVKIKDGTVAYPNRKSSSHLGMALELRDVSFTYPNTKTNSTALNNVSLTIKPGQLVVIVGTNGSGKSTILKLLTRLYDTSSGEVLVDGLPIRDYRISDIREATAVLSQNHQLYPLSLRENIGLGDPVRLLDCERLIESARDGGALELIEKHENGLDTVLQPVLTAWGYDLDPEKHIVLQKRLEELEKKAEVSGGEAQRLVAARTFMRMRSGKVRLVVVDEPSSALDPKAELQLFDRLRQSRAGKTMVFVTHRFSHLTKHADMIICMKDGKVAEIGTHDELITLDSEYAEIYNMQAKAFGTDSEADRVS